MKLLIFYKSRSGSTWYILYTIFPSEELYWRRERKVEKGREKESQVTHGEPTWERRVDTRWRECVFSWINNVVVGEVACSRNGWAVCIYVYYTVDRKFEVNIIRDEVIWVVEPEYCYRKFYQTSMMKLNYFILNLSNEIQEIVLIESKILIS